LDEAGAGQQVGPITLVRLRQAVVVVDELDDLLGEGPQLGDGARRVGVGVLLGERPQGRQVLPLGSKVLEVLGLHTTPRPWAKRNRPPVAAWPGLSQSFQRFPGGRPSKSNRRAGVVSSSPFRYFDLQPLQLR